MMLAFRLKIKTHKMVDLNAFNYKKTTYKFSYYHFVPNNT